VGRREADSVKVFVLRVLISVSFTHSGSTEPVSTRPRAGHARLGYKWEMIGDRRPRTRGVCLVRRGNSQTTPRAVLFLEFPGKER
jgi:hypothetical protein